MEKKYNPLISCKEALHRCDKMQYKEADFFERVTLKLHLAVCNYCRKYSKKNKKLTELFQNGDIQSISSEKKQIMHSRVANSLSQQNTQPPDEE